MADVEAELGPLRDEDGNLIWANLYRLLHLQNAAVKAKHLEKYGPKPAQPPVPGPYDVPPRKSTLEALPPEVLDLVIEACDAPADLDTLPLRVRAWGSLCLASKKLRKAALPRLYRSAVFRDVPIGLSTFMTSADPEIKELVQELVLDHRLPGPWPLAPIPSANIHSFSNLKRLVLEDPEGGTAIQHLPGRFDLFPKLETCILSVDRGSEAVRAPAILHLTQLLKFWCSPNLIHFEVEKSTLCYETFQWTIIPVDLSPVKYLGFSNCEFVNETMITKSLLAVRATPSLSLRGSICAAELYESFPPLGKIPCLDQLAPYLAELDYHIRPGHLHSDVAYPSFRDISNLRALTINIKNLGEFAVPDYKLSTEAFTSIAVLPASLERLAIEIFTWQINRFTVFRLLIDLIRDHKSAAPSLKHLHLRFVQTKSGPGIGSISAKDLEWSSYRRSKAECAAHKIDPDPNLNVQELDDIVELRRICKDAEITVTVEDLMEDCPRVRGFFREIFSWYPTASTWHWVAPYHLDW